MTKESLEHLSSLMDGEMSRETGLFMARRLSSDDDLGQAWGRYHLIRDCLRRSGTQASFVDISARVRLALDSEPEQQPTGRKAAWFRPAAGMAIAASVALLAIGVVGNPQRPTEDQPEAFSAPNVLPAVPRSRPVSYSPAVADPRLNSYLVRHNQLAGSAGMQGFVSFVPLISNQATETDGSEGKPALDAEPAPERTEQP